MSKDNVLFSVIGVLLGFIIGFMFANNANPNGNPPGSWTRTGQIYKMELDGTVLVNFGKDGKLAPGFQVVHMIDCRNPDVIYTGEIESWRMQKFVLKGSK